MKQIGRLDRTRHRPRPQPPRAAGEADWPAGIRTRHDRDPSRLARLVKQIRRLDHTAMSRDPSRLARLVKQIGRLDRTR